MKSNNDALKKHHFWILAAIAPILVILAVVFMMTGVSGAIDKANTEVKTNDDLMKSAKAPGQGLLQDLEAKKEQLGGVRGKLWQMNWDKQAPFFTWPETSRGMFDKYNTMKFGTSFRDFVAETNLIEQFKPAYTAAYTKMGESISPTIFKGDWSSVLRWVRDWGTVSPDSKQMWLVMEDVWIQRAMLDPISRVNSQISQFTLVRPEGAAAPPAKKRKFLSRVWELDLEVAPRDPAQGTGQVLKGKLKNRTSQLQVLGVGSAMILKVWLDPNLDIPPFEFRIEGAGVPGGEPYDIPPLPSHVIPPGINVVEIAKVEQVLDKRTVPIRRLDRLAIGYPSSRDATKALLNPTFWPDAAPADPAAGNSNTAVGDGSSSMSAPPGAPPGVGGAQAVTAAPRGRSGGLRLVEVADANRLRYSLVTEQLRRVPVAFTLVVDQMYVNDVLIAYANSALRFETSQVHWARFTESLNAPSTTTSPDSSYPPGTEGGAETATVSGYTGSGLSSGPPMSRSGLDGGLGLPPTSSFSSSPNQFGGIPGLGADTLSSVSEAQANSGLVQLTIYGLVTLYERYEAPKKEGETATTDPSTTTDPAAPKPMDPSAAKPMDPSAPKTDGEASKPEVPMPEKKADAAVPEKKPEIPMPEKKPDTPMPEKKPETVPPVKEPMK